VPWSTVLGEQWHPAVAYCWCLCICARSMQRYEKGVMLGKGSYGRAVLARDLKDGKQARLEQKVCEAGSNRLAQTVPECL
jgi:hypothetical protein